MTHSDLQQLVDFGFEEARAKIATKKTRSLQDALDWLEKNQDKSLEELQAEHEDDAEEEEEGGGGANVKIAASEDGATAKSLACKECGKLFKNADLASFHATKSGHTDFEESTEEIAPLTEEQKKQKLEELRQKLKEKRAKQSVEDKEDQKRNEKIRMKSTKETQDLKEDLQRKEQIKEAAKKRQERADDLEAKRIIKARIEADKAERKRKADEAKRVREGGAAAPADEPTPAPSTAAGPSAPRPAHTEARLRLQTASGNVMKTLPAETTLFEVAQQIEMEQPGVRVTSFTMTFPKKTFENGVDFGQTLKEAGLVPSAVLIVK